jgi:hypothetical protein
MSQSVINFYLNLAHPVSYPMDTRGSFPEVKVVSTTHLHLVPRSLMRGAMPPFPNTPSWRGAQLKAQV